MARRRRRIQERPAQRHGDDSEVTITAADRLHPFWALDPRLPMNGGAGTLNSWDPADVLAWAERECPALVLSDEDARANAERRTRAEQRRREARR